MNLILFLALILGKPYDKDRRQIIEKIVSKCMVSNNYPIDSYSKHFTKGKIGERIYIYQEALKKSMPKIPKNKSFRIIRSAYNQNTCFSVKDNDVYIVIFDDSDVCLYFKFHGVKIQSLIPMVKNDTIIGWI